MKKYGREDVDVAVEKFVKTSIEVFGYAYAVGYMTSMMKRFIETSKPEEQEMAINQLNQAIVGLYEISHERMMREKKVKEAA